MEALFFYLGLAVRWFAIVFAGESSVATAAQSTKLTSSLPILLLLVDAKYFH